MTSSDTTMVSTPLPHISITKEHHRMANPMKPAKVTDVAKEHIIQNPWESYPKFSPLERRQLLYDAGAAITHNIVASGVVSWRGDTLRLAWDIVGAVWPRFAKPLCFYAHYPSFTILLFGNNGRVVVTGCKSPTASLISTHAFCEYLYQVKGLVVVFKEHTIQNQLSCVYPGFIIDFDRVAREYEGVWSYEKDPKVRRLNAIKARYPGHGKALIYPTASFVITGTKNDNDISIIREDVLKKLVMFARRPMTKQELFAAREEIDKELKKKRKLLQTRKKQFRTKSKVVTCSDVKLSVDELKHVVDLKEIKVHNDCVKEHNDDEDEYDGCVHTVWVKYDDIDEFKSLGRLHSSSIQQLYDQNNMEISDHFINYDELLYDDGGDMEDDDEEEDGDCIKKIGPIQAGAGQAGVKKDNKTPKHKKQKTDN